MLTAVDDDAMSRTFSISGGVGRQLERLGSLRLQPKGSPHAADGHVTQTRRLRQRPRAPVRGPARRGFEGAHDHRLDLRADDLHGLPGYRVHVVDRWRPAGVEEAAS